MKTRRVFVIGVLMAATAGLHGQSAPNFAGKWVLNAAKSKNLGMMAALEDTLTISQTPTELVIKDDSSFQGQHNSRELHYNLTGKTSTNEGPMGDRNETVAKWMGGTLVATWTRDGAVAGTKSVMTEARSLSGDGKTMTVESARGANPPLVMVFDRR
jgi:hypothetical protein